MRPQGSDVEGLDLGNLASRPQGNTREEIGEHPGAVDAMKLLIIGVGILKLGACLDKV